MAAAAKGSFNNILVFTRGGNHINGGTITARRPSINHIAVDCTLEVGIQGHVLTNANIHCRSSDLQIGSNRGNRERTGNRLATIFALGNHIIGVTRNSLMGRVGAESRTTVPGIFLCTSCMSDKDRSVIVADNALTFDIDIGRSILHIDGSVGYNNTARE